MVALGPFAFTEAMPLSRADTEEYVSLVPMRSLFAALRLHMGLPSEAFLRSSRSSCGAFCFTDSMPFKAPPFDISRQTLRLVSSFQALRTIWNSPGEEYQR